MGEPAPAVTRRRLPLLGLAPLLVPLTLFGPMALHWSAFSLDWGNHLFLVATMEHSIRTLGHPSYFVHTTQTGLYYPFFAFYGGTVYVLGGLLGLALGSPVRGYVASYGLCFAATYGGMYWLARLGGLRGLAAHVPPIVAITGAYYLTNAYARGAWPELVATSAIPLLSASVVDLLIRRTVRVRSLLAVYGAAVVFTGSHNITLLWGSIVLLLVALAAVLAIGVEAARAYLPRAGLAAGLVLLAAGTNAWFLLPDLTYSGQTVVSQSPHVGGFQFDSVGVVLNPWRVSPLAEAPTLYVQVSIYVLAWSLAILLLAAVAGVGSREARVFAAGLVVLLAALLALVLFDSLWADMPRTLQFIQFPYRLQTYILLLTAVLSLLAVHAARLLPHARAAFALLALAVACQIGLAERQVWIARHDTAGATLAAYAGSGAVPPTWYASGDYRVETGRLVVPTGTFELRASLVRDDRISVPMTVGAGAYETNVVASPFVAVSGAATDAGRSSSNLLVARRTGSEPKGVPLTLRPRVPGVELAGVVLSVLCVLAIVALCVGTWRRTRPAPGL